MHDANPLLQCRCHLQTVAEETIIVQSDIVLQGFATGEMSPFPSQDEAVDWSSWLDSVNWFDVHPSAMDFFDFLQHELALRRTASSSAADISVPLPVRVVFTCLNYFSARL